MATSRFMNMVMHTEEDLQGVPDLHQGMERLKQGWWAAHAAEPTLAAAGKGQPSPGRDAHWRLAARITV
jgi:hypothetical protein